MFSSSSKFIFFSTSKANAKAFFHRLIEIQEKLENDFNKEKLINEGFKKAFNKLMNNWSSRKIDKVTQAKLNEIKSMIQTNI